MISIAYEPDVRWLLVRTGKPSAEHWQEERDCKLKLRSSSTSLFPGTAATPPVLLPPGEFILSLQPHIVDFLPSPHTVPYTPGILLSLTAPKP